MEKNDKMWLAVAITFGVALGTPIIYSVVTGKEEIKTNNTNLCPTDRANIDGYTAVLLDVSDPLKGKNAEEFKQQVLKIGKDLPLHGKLALFDITDTSRPILSRCRTMRIDECTITTRGGCGKRRLKIRYERKFEAPILENVDTFLGQQTTSQFSPIIEAISDISQLTDFRETKDKQLHIFSDMLQNANVYSHYGRKISRDEFAELKKQQYYKEHKPDLENVSVTMHYLHRKRNRRRQTENHRLFWHDFFQASRASVEIIDMNFGNGDARWQ